MAIISLTLSQVQLQPNTVMLDDTLMKIAVAVNMTFAPIHFHRVNVSVVCAINNNSQDHIAIVTQDFVDAYKGSIQVFNLTKLKFNKNHNTMDTKEQT